MRPLSPILLLALSSPSFAQDGGIDAHGFHLATHDGDLLDPLTMERPSPFHQGDVYFGTVLEYANKPLVAVIAAGDQQLDEQAVLRDLGVVNVSAGVAPIDYWRIDVTAPIYALSTDHMGTIGGPAPGDLRIHNTVNFVRPEHIEGGTGFGAGATMVIDVPLGDETRFLGKSGLAGAVEANATYEWADAAITAGAGLQFNPAVDVSNLQGSDQFLGGLAVSYMPGELTGLNLEVRAAPELSKNQLQGASLPAEVLTSLKQVGPSNTYFTFGLAKSLAPGVGAANFRAFLGWGIGHRDPPRPPDFDPIVPPEAIADACPMEWESLNGWLDDDGCPDDLGSLTVRTLYEGKPWPETKLHIEGFEDGPKDVVAYERPLTFDKTMPGTRIVATATTDQCLFGDGEVEVGEGPAELRVDLKRVLKARINVEVVERVEGEEAEGEAPEAPAPSPFEVAPVEPEAPTGEGAEVEALPEDDGNYKPVPGATVTWNSDQELCIPDGTMALDSLSRGSSPIGPGTHHVVVGAPDFIVFEDDVVVIENEINELRVVLERIPEVVEVKPTAVRIEKKQIVIDDKIFFETNKAVIKSESFELLDEIATVIMDNPDVGRIEIGGHTDSQGGEAYNLGLSVKRAQAVRSYFIARGVSPDRLLAAGFGETQPIDTNETAEGREKNRRVEFLLVDVQDEEEESP